MDSTYLKWYSVAGLKSSNVMSTCSPLERKKNREIRNFNGSFKGFILLFIMIWNWYICYQIKICSMWFYKHLYSVILEYSRDINRALSILSQSGKALYIIYKCYLLLWIYFKTPTKTQTYIWRHDPCLTARGHISCSSFRWFQPFQTQAEIIESKHCEPQYLWPERVWY